RSMVDTVSPRKARASLSFLAIRVRRRRTRVRSWLRRARLMALRRRFLRMFFSADWMRATTSPSVCRRSLGDENELGAAVRGPGGLVVPRIERPFLAEADGAQALRRDPDRDQVVLGRPRAPVAQRQVVLHGAPLVAVPLDAHVEAAVLADASGVAAQG